MICADEVFVDLLYEPLEIFVLYRLELRHQVFGFEEALHLLECRRQLIVFLELSSVYVLEAALLRELRKKDLVVLRRRNIHAGRLAHQRLVQGGVELLELGCLLLSLLVLVERRKLDGL